MTHEETFIGSCLIGVDQHTTVSLEPEDFANEFCRGVWMHIRNQRKINMAELVTHFDEQALTTIVSGVYSSSGIEDEAVFIRKDGHRRRLAFAINHAAAMVDGGAETSEIANYLISAFDDAPATGEAVELSELLPDVYNALEAAQNGESLNFVPTGFRDFDFIIGGLQDAGLIVIAGRPSMGKTAFATGIARNIGKEKPVLMVSMEMTARQMGMRFLAAERQVDLQKMMQGKLVMEDWRKISSAVSSIQENSKVWINELTNRTVSDVAAEARRFKRRHGDIGLLVVDYLTLLSMPSENLVQAVAEVSRGFKLLAGELGCPVLLLSQLNRSLEKRPNKKPLMSDLRDSGAIEQDADMILFPYRPCVYDDKAPKGDASILVAKNRNGQTGEVHITWLPKSATFQDKARDY